MKDAAGETTLRSLMMTIPSSEMGGDTLPHADRGTGLLFWGWIVVTLLNLVMVSVSLAIFAP
jgi:hypothetical protein